MSDVEHAPVATEAAPPAPVQVDAEATQVDATAAVETTATDAPVLEEVKAGEAVVKPEEGEGERERGTFKKRPRDAAEDPSTMLCRGVAAGEGCAFGDSCKFSHDVADYMKRRPKDFEGPCPVYTALGYCRYGLNCRYGLSHVDASGTKNLGTPADEKSVEVNDLDTATRDMLRKNKYPFRSVPASHQKKGKKPKTARDVEYDVLDNPEPAAHKPVDFKGKIFVGPLTTVGNLPFRRVLKHWGADITIGEMAMATNLLQGQASEWALLRRHESEDVFGVQIAGAYGDQIARVCELITRKTSVDFIDINMGCPIDLGERALSLHSLTPAMCKSGAGAALMNRAPKLCSVVSGALTGIELGSLGLASRPSLTVKMRAGWSEKTPIAHKLLPKVQSTVSSAEFMNQSVVLNYALKTNVHVDALTIHGRSRLQRYTKNADWVYVAECSDARGEDKSMQMIGGGDVLSYEEFHEHLKSGQIDTCMLARFGYAVCEHIPHGRGSGALIKPWLPTEIKERRHYDISASERLDILKDFVKCGLEHWGSDQKGINRTRRYLLEWQSFLCRYVPVGILEKLPQRINDRPMPYYGRNDLETLMASDQATDWVKISEMLLGPVPEGFQFVPKHKANAYG
ncbi:tRNA-dihydrouridine synthase 3 [Achlya hypogyna]|uniref:tRNA-dihydrouridine(47) synthase [NAD(P)(+)] n=1 Tax=Achlya hypogyna TaxID=1202772 RepID=A0A1V9ZI39_ACHHY|nr:tRNA-dihydrouridine synthase 3 [Achlya hypogyna]